MRYTNDTTWYEQRKRSEHYVNNKEFLALLSHIEMMLKILSSKSMEDLQSKKIGLKDGILNLLSHAILVSVS